MTKNTKRGWNQVNIRKADHDKLKFIAKLTGKEQSQIIGQFIDSMYQLACSHDFKAFDATYEISVLPDSIEIQWSGSRTLIIGKARSDEEVSEKIDENRKMREVKKRFG